MVIKMYVDIILIFIILFVPLIADIKVRSNYSKYSKEKNSLNLSGKEVARRILDNNGLNYIDIVPTKGHLTDHYNPITKKISLSESSYDSKSIAGAAIAAHEVGHAIQDKECYSFLRFRNKMVPFVNFTSRVASILIILSFVFNILDMLDAGIILLLVGLFFQLITLPVEFNASHRALIQIENLGIVSRDESRQSKKVLSAAALTYVAAAATALLQLLRLITIANQRDD